MARILVKPNETKLREEILLFDEEDLDLILKELHDVHIEKCEICDDPLTKENIGAFFPGSVKAICEKFSCHMSISDKLRREKIAEL